MARVKYDVRGVESSGGTPLPPGVYNAKITQADVTKPDGKDQRIEVILEVINSEKENNGKKLYEYINLESDAAKWKLKEYLEALGEGTDTGSFDTDDHLNKVIGVKTIVRPADEARGFDARAAVRRMFAIDESLRNGASAPTEVLDDPEPEPVAEVADEDDGEELTWDELNGMDRAALKQLNKDEQVGIAVKKSMTDDDLRAAIAQYFELPPLVVEEEAEEDEEEDEEPEAEAEAAEEDEAAGDEDDYDEWSDADLKEELSQRSLSTKGSKKVLIGRLRRDDNAEDKPF